VLPSTTFVETCSLTALARRKSSRKRRGLCRRAFTLLEIIIAIAILGLLTGLAINNLTGNLRDAEITVAQTFVGSTMKLPLTSYRLHMGDYPTTAEGLVALEAAPQGKADRWKGPYLDGKLPTDPWKNPYQYRYPGTHNKDRYDIWSKGPDGVDGTADDICNWSTADASGAK